MDKDRIKRCNLTQPIFGHKKTVDLASTRASRLYHCQQSELTLDRVYQTMRTNLFFSTFSVCLYINTNQTSFYFVFQSEIICFLQEEIGNLQKMCASETNRTLLTLCHKISIQQEKVSHSVKPFYSHPQGFTFGKRKYYFLLRYIRHK